MIDFDTVRARQGTFSTKWDKYRGRDVLPMWVADMDIAAPEQIVSAIKTRADHGIFGYNEPPDDLFSVYTSRCRDMYGWTVEPDHLVFSPGVVPVLNQAIQAYVNEHQSVVTATPVYHPFLLAPEYCGRTLRTISCEQGDDGWQFPVDRFRDLAASDPSLRLLLLSNPHNPIGRHYGPGELQAIAEICLANDILICSDEIHCDLLFDNRSHCPTASLGDDVANITVTCMAASKTFNVAGLGGSVTVIANPALRARFEEAGRGIMANVNTFAYVAMLTAWRDCESWRQSLLAYLQANRDFLMEEIAGIDSVQMARVEGTYLAWLDIRALDLADPVTHFEQSGLGLSGGEQFGLPGFVRLNFGCARSSLSEGLARFRHGLGAG